MISYIKTKILSNTKIYLFTIIYIIFIVIIVFLMLGFRDISKAKIEDEIKFYENSILINYGAKSNLYPDGYMPTAKNINEIKQKYSNVTEYMSLDFTVSGRQQVDFVAVSKDFISTGVPFYDLDLRTNIVQKIDLLYGNVWDDDLKPSDKIIVDEKTANLIFGFSNVVGNSLTSGDRDFEIIGVVSETYEREQYIRRSMEGGNTFEEYTIPTKAYLHYSFAKEENYAAFNHNIVISDSSYNTIDLTKTVLELLKVENTDTGIILSRNELINQRLIDNGLFFQLILSLTLVFSLLGITNLINISIFNYRSDLKKIGIYKTIGFSNNRMVLISIFEGTVLGFISSGLAIFISLVILILSSLIRNAMVYLNIMSLIKQSVIIILVVTCITTIISFIVTIIGYFKPVIYFLKGEE